MFGVERCALASQMVQRTELSERERGREERKSVRDTTKQTGNGDDNGQNLSKGEQPFFALSVWLCIDTS